MKHALACHSAIELPTAFFEVHAYFTQKHKRFGGVAKTPCDSGHCVHCVGIQKSKIAARISTERVAAITSHVTKYPNVGSFQHLLSHRIYCSPLSVIGIVFPEKCHTNAPSAQYEKLRRVDGPSPQSIGSNGRISTMYHLFI